MISRIEEMDIPPCNVLFFFFLHRALLYSNMMFNHTLSFCNCIATEVMFWEILLSATLHIDGVPFCSFLQSPRVHLFPSTLCLCRQLAKWHIITRDRVHIWPTVIPCSNKHIHIAKQLARDWPPDSIARGITRLMDINSARPISKPCPYMVYISLYSTRATLRTGELSFISWIDLLLRW